MNAMPNNEHQSLVSRLTYVLHFVIADSGKGVVFPGCNVSDRPKRWRENYRVPDVAVFLKGTRAVDKNTHWLGGPDLAIEIVSPRDRSRKKLDFYAHAGTRELLLVDRNPWSLELFRLVGHELQPVGKSTVDAPEALETATVSLTWSLRAAEGRPTIEIAAVDGLRRWQA
jgi:Uma2 family endonuclease